MKILLLAKTYVEYYIDAVRCVGAEPVLDCDTLDGIGGVILCGGSDVDPALYGEAIDGACAIDKERDLRELPLAREAIRRGIPVLGICRGLQLLNVLFGGTLIQHLENVQLHNEPGCELYPTHEVRAVRGSVAERLYGEHFIVNTSHHQAIKRLGDGLLATIYAPDGVIEGVEHESLPVLAVQWHPERMAFGQRREDTVDGRLVFEYFLEMCQRR